MVNEWTEWMRLSPMTVGPALETLFSPTMTPIFVAPFSRIRKQQVVVQDRGYRHERDIDPVLTVPQPPCATMSSRVKGKRGVNSGFPKCRPWPIELRALVNQTLSVRQEKERGNPSPALQIPHLECFDSLIWSAQPGKVPRPICDVSRLPWQRRQTFRGDLTAEPGSCHMTRGLETGRVTEGHLLGDHGGPTPPKAEPLAGGGFERTPGWPSAPESGPPARGGGPRGAGAGSSPSASPRAGAGGDSSPCPAPTVFPEVDHAPQTAPPQPRTPATPPPRLSGGRGAPAATHALPT